MPPRKSFTPTVTTSPTILGFVTAVAEEQSIAFSGQHIRLHPLDYVSVIGLSGPGVGDNLIFSSPSIAFDPVFHQEGSGVDLENMMNISAMSGFRHMSVEELRVASWNLGRQLKAAGGLGTAERLQPLRLDNSEGDTTRTQKTAGLSGIPASPSTARPSNNATGPPPAVPSSQVAPSPPVFKGTEIGGPGIAGSTSGTASTNVEDRKPTSSSSNLGFARFNLPEGYVSLVPPKLGTGTGKSDQAAGAAVVPPTPMPAPTANSAPQVHNAPQPSGLGSQADTSPITFPLCPAAEQNSTVADAEKEWVHASRQAHETKAQLAKVQAAHDQAIMMEKLKFKAYCEARNKADE